MKNAGDELGFCEVRARPGCTLIGAFGILFEVITVTAPLQYRDEQSVCTMSNGPPVGYLGNGNVQSSRWYWLYTRTGDCVAVD